MALSKKLLEILVCPACKEKLEYEEKKDRLICNKCQLSYRVMNNIPVLLADEAEKI